MKSYKSCVRAWWDTKTKNEKANGCDATGERLPKDIYSNMAGWKLHTALLALVQSGAFVVVFSCSLTIFEIVSTISTTFHPSLILLLSSVLLGLLFSSYARDSKLNISDYMELWATVAVVEPHGDVSEWDRVASHMNEYLVTDSAAGRPAQFYDGEECMQRFKKRYSASLLPKERQRGSEFEDLRPYIEEAIDAASDD
ncbi:LAQU0S05e03950g1_1 [Lachancea quebecensis]|uniref:LAQU0S05e03950g1_1 n=1 Tax=Lachancea quebecensis TaxID=1654605 RepID=A0A0N7MLI4_9SACH|nr:LAQU0S05e03950g1_1 [Lachancea quebecensis]